MKRLLCWCWVLLLLVPMTGCSGQTSALSQRGGPSRLPEWLFPSSAQNCPAPETKQKLTIYAVHTGNTYPVLITGWFEFNHPDIALEIKDIDASGELDAASQILQELAAGQGPDVLIYLNAASKRTSLLLRSLLREGGFCDLKPLMERAGLAVDDYFPYQFQNVNFDQEMRTLALTSSIRMMVCTEERERQLGLDVENNLTVSGFSGELDKILGETDESLEIFCPTPTFSAFLQYAGGGFLDYQKKTTAFHSREFLDAVACYQKLYSRKRHVTSYDIYYGDMEEFIEGRALFSLSDSRFFLLPEIHSFIAPINRETMTVYPHPYFQKAVSVNSIVGGILEKCNRKDLAIEYLLREMSRNGEEQRQRSFAEAYFRTLGESVRTYEIGPYQSVDLPLPEKILNTYTGFLDAAEGYVPDSVLLRDYIELCMQPYFDGAETLENCIAELESRTEAYLKALD